MPTRNALFFSEDEKSKIKLLTMIGLAHIRDNHKRVVNAFGEAFEMLIKKLEQPHNEKDKAKIIKEFEKLSAPFLRIDDLLEEFFVACLCTGQYSKGLDICDSALKNGIILKDEADRQRAEFLAQQGNIIEARDLMLENLKQKENDVWTCISLGDIYFVWQTQDEFRNIEEAEAWYYQAYDKGLGNPKTDGGRALLERLGDICVERLRRDAERKLLLLLRNEKIGDWRTMVQLRDNVLISGSESIMFNHLQNRLMETADDINEANRRLGILGDYYNLLPQKGLDELSPFEMREYFPDGEHSLRIKTETLDEFSKLSGDADPEEPAGAIFSEKFSAFQEKFLREIDPVTGKKRHKIIEEERKQARKRYESDKFIWTGFLHFRR